MSVRTESGTGPDSPEQFHALAAVVTVTGNSGLTGSGSFESCPEFGQGFLRDRGRPCFFTDTQRITIQQGPCFFDSPFFTCRDKQNVHMSSSSGRFENRYRLHPIG